MGVDAGGGAKGRAAPEAGVRSARSARDDPDDRGVSGQEKPGLGGEYGQWHLPMKQIKLNPPPVSGKPAAHLLSKISWFSIALPMV